MGFFESVTSNNTIGVCIIGGIGDTIYALNLCSALKRKYPYSCITLFSRDKIPFFYNHKDVDIFHSVGSVYQYRVVKKYKNKFKRFYDIKFVTGVYKDGKLVNPYFINNYGEYYYDMFKHLPERNENLLDLIYRTSGVKYNKFDFDLRYLILNNKLEKILNYDYVVVHNAYDKFRKTKSWHLNNWNKLVSSLNEHVKVIQVGLKNEFRIDGVIDLCGKLTLEETASVLRGAKLLIDTEGGLVHLANSMGTKSVVLFGPTKVSNYGYKDNINLESDSECSGCWYTKKDWYKRCPINGKGICDSINKISYKVVLKSILNYLNKR